MKADSHSDAISWAKTVSKTYAQVVENAQTMLQTESAQDGGKTGTVAIPLVGGHKTEPPVAPQVDSRPHGTSEPRYEVIEVLGQGGMGRVLAVRDAQFGRIVALKEMTHGAESPDFIRRFLLESIVTANLEHPGIVPVYERGVRDGAPYYAMRKIAGKTLTNAIVEARSLEARLALVPAVIRAAHALGFAHARDVVHRDIKPDNIILGDHGETVILDWGIAKVRGLEQSLGADSPLAAIAEQSKETVVGSVLGTPSYMAPEQAKGDISSIDSRSDVFALGAVLYEVLAGRPPYAESSVVMTLARASAATFEPLEKVAPKAPKALVAIVSKALSQDPAQRFANGSELAQTLEEFQSRAWLGEESQSAKWFTRATVTAGFLLLVVSSVMVWRGLPSLREMGVGSFVYVFTFFAMLGLAVLEWRTQGRYRLLGLAMAFNIATPLLGLAAAIAGMVRLFGGLSTPALVQDESRWREIYSLGLYEAVGNVAGSAVFAAVGAMVLALVHRAGAAQNSQAR